MPAKVCAKCGRRRALAMFSRHPATRDRLYPDCKLCRAAYTRKWRKANAARVRAVSAAYLKKNRARINAHSLRWHRANRGKHMSMNAAWAARNPGKRSAYTAAHRAAKLRATPPWADLKKIERIYERAAKRGMTVDHAVPLRSPVVCGLHVEANLRIIPRATNSAKGNRWEGRWER
jgi:hypothetical protein